MKSASITRSSRNSISSKKSALRFFPVVLVLAVTAFSLYREFSARGYFIDRESGTPYVNHRLLSKTFPPDSDRSFQFTLVESVPFNGTINLENSIPSVLLQSSSLLSAKTWSTADSARVYWRSEPKGWTTVGVGGGTDKQYRHHQFVNVDDYVIASFPSPQDDLGSFARFHPTEPIMFLSSVNSLEVWDMSSFTELLRLENESDPGIPVTWEFFIDDQVLAVERKGEIAIYRLDKN